MNFFLTFLCASAAAERGLLGEPESIEQVKAVADNKYKDANNAVTVWSKAVIGTTAASSLLNIGCAVWRSTAFPKDFWNEEPAVIAKELQENHLPAVYGWAAAYGLVNIGVKVTTIALYINVWKSSYKSLKTATYVAIGFAGFGFLSLLAFFGILCSSVKKLPDDTFEVSSSAKWGLPVSALLFVLGFWISSLVNCFGVSIPACCKSKQKRRRLNF